MTKTMELKQKSERCFHLQLTNECNAREMSEMMTNKAQDTPGAYENYGNGKERENSSGVMELSQAHIIDLMHAVSFISFKGNAQ